MRKHGPAPMLFLRNLQYLKQKWVFFFFNVIVTLIFSY
jgi:hypothetical protein